MSVTKTRIVMEESQSVRDAVIVIEERWNEVFAERIAIAYRQLESPRELRGASSEQLRRRVRFTETRVVACATLQNALVTGVLMFYSRSILGAVIRGFVGA
jgi:hypothetical protein